MADYRDNRGNSNRSSRRSNNCIDSCVREKFDPMSPDEFADYVASNPLDAPKIFYYLSNCSPERNQALMDGFGRHPYFSEENCRCYGRRKKPILDLVTEETPSFCFPISAN